MEIFLVSIVLTLLSSSFVLVNFFPFVITGKLITNNKLWRIVEIWVVVLLPIVFVSLFDLPLRNDCCSDSAVFSPEHRIGIYFLIITYTIAYVVSIFRKEILTPVLELLLNMFLVLGLILNIAFCFHFTTEEEGPLLWIFGNIPIILMLLIKLAQNQIKLKLYIEKNGIEPNGVISKYSLIIMNLSPIYKFPILLVLLVPLLILLSLFLLLFGQKPDSIIKAFTDTYKHGFSQLDYMCDNVECGGHFLCSVGANGHKEVVKPIRYGERNGAKIICTRQLLISNAFEELIQEKFPKAHRLIRNNYNKVGDVVRKYYAIFNIKLVSDFVYLAMKPLEWAFLLALYILDKKPENRIAIQYLNKIDRQLIDERIERKQRTI